ncbi:MAG: hypothetical protein V1921_04760 [Candidatus Altiarchaeota archaeon]
MTVQQTKEDSSTDRISGQDRNAINGFLFFIGRSVGESGIQNIVYSLRQPSKGRVLDYASRLPVEDKLTLLKGIELLQETAAHNPREPQNPILKEMEPNLAANLLDRVNKGLFTEIKEAATPPSMKELPDAKKPKEF